MKSTERRKSRNVDTVHRHKKIKWIAGQNISLKGRLQFQKRTLKIEKENTTEANEHIGEHIQERRENYYIGVELLE